MQGLYAIINKTGQRVYIGSSVNLKRRLYQHKHALKHGTHSKALQVDYKAGIVFDYIILYTDSSLSPLQLTIAENDLIKAIKPHLLYNCSSGVVRKGWGQGILSESQKAGLHIRQGKRITTDSIAALCQALECQPGDLLEYVEE